MQTMNTSVATREALLGELGENLRVIGRRVWLKHGGIAGCFSPAQDQLIMVVGADEQTTVKQLATALHITPGAVTQQVEALEKAGVLTRSINQDDRREVMVSLTRKGRTSLKEIRKVNLHLLDEAFGKLNGYELEMLVELTAKATDT